MGHVDLAGVIYKPKKKKAPSYLERDPEKFNIDPNYPDILIYQPGRVGSNTLYDILRKQMKENTHHLHTLGISSKSKSWDVPDRIASRDEKFFIVTIVREPLARNLSAWKSFFNCRTNFAKEFDHDKILNWFDNEIKHYIGVDVFNYPFDNIAKWMIIRENRTYPILILRTEDIDSTAETALKAFIPFRQRDKKIRPEHKAVSEPYDIPPLPKSLVDKMLQSKYCRHFYSDDEIEGFYRKYEKYIVENILR